MNKEILLVDKPEGITSFELLRRLKRVFDDPKLKLGHAGTLDPMASGLMVVGVGAGTKKLKEYVGLDKTYAAEILLGVQTDSGDITGNITEARPPHAEVGPPEVTKALEGMVGTLRLPVSKYSAMKQGGEPLYKKVRARKKFIIPLRDMEVRNIKDISYDQEFKIVSATFEVGSGTYIRSLAEELGKQLNVPATLKKLRRTKVGEFDVNQKEVVRVEAR